MSACLVENELYGRGTGRQVQVPNHVCQVNAMPWHAHRLAVFAASGLPFWKCMHIHALSRTQSMDAVRHARRRQSISARSGPGRVQRQLRLDGSLGPHHGHSVLAMTHNRISDGIKPAQLHFCLCWRPHKGLSSSQLSIIFSS